MKPEASQAEPDRAKLTAALNEVLALLKQDQEFKGCITVSVAFCLGPGLISVQVKDDVQHEDWLIQVHDDHALHQKAKGRA